MHCTVFFTWKQTIFGPSTFLPPPPKCSIVRKERLHEQSSNIASRGRREGANIAGIRHEKQNVPHILARIVGHLLVTKVKSPSPKRIFSGIGEKMVALSDPVSLPLLCVCRRRNWSSDTTNIALWTRSSLVSSTKKPGRWGSQISRSSRIFLSVCFWIWDGFTTKTPALHWWKPDKWSSFLRWNSCSLLDQDSKWIISLILNYPNRALKNPARDSSQVL